MLIYPSFVRRDREIKVEEYVEGYLTEKYGDCAFDTVNIEKEYSSGTMFESEFVGYYLEIESNKTEDTFIVYIGKDSTQVTVDYFLPLYYSEQLGVEYKKQIDDGDEVASFYDFSKLEQFIREDMQSKYWEDLCWHDISDLYEYMEYSETPTNPYIALENQGRILTLDEIEELLMSIDREKVS